MEDTITRIMRLDIVRMPHKEVRNEDVRRVLTYEIIVS